MAKCRIARAPTNLAGYDPRRGAEGLHFDAAAATRAVEFFPAMLSHVQGQTGPLVLAKWQRDFIATLFGWKRPDGTRRYRESLLAVPRKNGKTTLAAGIALLVLVTDAEQGAQVYCAASDRDQATLVFDPASKMVKASPRLSSRLKVLDATKRILYPATNSFMRAIPADAAGSHGFNAHAVIMDELHTQPNRDLYDVLKTSQASRTQPLMLSITTAGFDQESICYEVWDYARKVRDGVINDPFFLPVIYEATHKDDWTDEATWKRVNPNYGVSIVPASIRETCERAKTQPNFENTFKNLHLNLWTESQERWIGEQQWDACEAEEPDLSGAVAFGGLDLGSTDDMTALVWVFRLPDGRYWVKRHSWVPEETVYRGPKKYQSKYRSWVDQGLLYMTEGNATDYGAVRQQLEEDMGRYAIAELGFDGWQANDTINWAQARGIECRKIVQSIGGMCRGTKAVFEAVLAGDLLHEADEVLRWQIASTMTVSDGNDNKKPDKRKSQGERGTKGKIDAVVALVMAMQLAHCVEVAEPGIYFG